MGRLTCLANQSSAIVNGSFESQVIVRASVILVRKSQLKYVKHRAQKQQRAEKKSQRRLRAAQEADAESVRRSASRGTSSTAVVEEAPMLKKCNEGPIISALPYPAISSVSGLTGVIPLTADLGSHSLTQPNHADNGKDEGASKQPSPLHEIRTMVSDVMSEWTHKIFGREDEFSKDWESNELEAWVFCTSTAESAPIKVPFGHQRLQYGLRKTRSKTANSLGRTTFTRYIKGGSRMQMIVDEVVQEANRLQKREKVCLAFKEYNVGDGNNTFVVVFFSLCEEKAPLAFKDCIGRKMTLPFETCRTWECMSMHIVEAFRLMPEIGLHVMEGHYSLEDAKSGEHIIPGLWSNTIKPGDSINMTMWPHFNTHPILRQYQTPPFRRLPSEEAEDLSRRRRYLRMQNMLISTARRPIRGMTPAFHPGILRLPMPMGRPAPPPQRPILRRRSRPASSVSTNKEDEMTRAEEKELTFVNFVEELERMRDMTATDILAKYTQLHDVSSQDRMGVWGMVYSSSSSDSDDCLASSSSGSLSVAS